MTDQFCPTKLEKLLLATDGSEFSEGAVREAIKLAKRCASKLSVISVVETNPEYEALAPGIVEKAEKEARQNLESIKDRAAAEGVACETVIRQGENIYSYIVDEAAKSHIDMIIMGRRGRKGLSRLMLGSETARVIGHASCCVLVVPRAASIDFNKILVATDGSTYSDAAVREAVSISKRCNSTLFALTVVPSETESPFDLVHTETLKGSVSDQEFKMAERLISDVKELAEKEGVSAQGFSYSGKPYDAIVSTAKEKHADLIIVGSHGRTGLAKLLMGSVTERVIGLSECAVLVVKSS